jgi:predicted GTPase
VDTGGLEEDDDASIYDSSSSQFHMSASANGSLNQAIASQVAAAVVGSDLSLFVIDAREGVTPLDRHFALWCRRQPGGVERRWVVLLNKVSSYPPPSCLFNPSCLTWYSFLFNGFLFNLCSTLSKLTRQPHLTSTNKAEAIMHRAEDGDEGAMAQLALDVERLGLGDTMCFVSARDGDGLAELASILMPDIEPQSPPPPSQPLPLPPPSHQSSAVRTAAAAAATAVAADSTAASLLLPAAGGVGAGEDDDDDALPWDMDAQGGFPDDDHDDHDDDDKDYDKQDEDEEELDQELFGSDEDFEFAGKCFKQWVAEEEALRFAAASGGDDGGGGGAAASAASSFGGVLDQEEEEEDNNISDDDDIKYDDEEANKVSAAFLASRPIELAIVGRPNVGKSSIVNALLQSDRMVRRRMVRRRTKKTRGRGG